MQTPPAIRVTRQGRPPEAVVIVLEGVLDGSSAAMVDAACRDAAGSAAGSTLDLAGLRGTDGVGLATLARLKRDGWHLRSASLYLRMLLEETEP